MDEIVTNSTEVQDTEHFAELLNIAIGWALPAFFGVPGNMLALAVACKKSNRGLSASVYVGAMAVMDSLVSICPIWVNVQMRFKDFPQIVTKLYMYAMLTTSMLSGFYLAGMSVDRLIAVRFPMDAARLCTAFRAKLVTIVGTVITLVVNLHLLIVMHHIYDAELGVYILVIQDEPQWELLASGFQVVFGTVLPFVIIFGSNVIIIVTLVQASKERSKLSSGTGQGDTKLQKSTHYLTRMLLFVSFFYVVISLPYRMFHFVMKIPALEKLYDMTNVYWRARYVSEAWSLHIVFILNYSVNFFLYCIGGGQKYRNDVKEVLGNMFRCCRPTQK